jgi:hypothetical protein
MWAAFMGVPPVWSTVTHSEALHLIYALLSLSWTSIFFFFTVLGFELRALLEILNSQSVPGSTNHKAGLVPQPCSAT